MDATMTVISIVVFFFIAIITILLVILSKKKKIKNVSEDNINKIKSGAVVSDIYQEIPYKYRYFRGAQNSPPTFSISIDCESSGDFKISKETKFDRFFKKAGIAAEMGTNDQDFDDKYYISSNTPEFSMNLLGKSSIRKTIDSLISRGFTSLILKKNILSLKWTPYRTKSPLEHEEIERIIIELDSIKKDCSRINLREEERINTGWKTRRLLAFLIPGTLEVLGIAALVIGLVNYKPLDTLSLMVGSLKLSIPAFFLFIWIAIKLLKGRPSSHRELLIVFFISITAFPLAFSGGKIFLNGWMDNSVTNTHNVQIINKYFTRSKNSKTYYIKMRSWREDRETEKLSISYKKYMKVHPGETNIFVTTKDGKYGYEWIVDYYLE